MRTVSSAGTTSFSHFPFLLIQFYFRILKHLRGAAQSTTKLIVIEHLVPLACEEDDTYKHIPGAVPATLPPKPLLPNLGIVNMVPYFLDIKVRCLSRRSRRYDTHCLLITNLDDGAPTRLRAHLPALLGSAQEDWVGD